jgi:hypothetical protein
VDKKYLIVIVVTVVAAAGFFILKNQKNEKRLRTHRSQQYNRMIEVANKSPMAGLNHMGRALNEYKEEMGAYPAELAALYPKYIPVEAFIDEIQWYYEPRDDDFYLRKTYKTKNNKVLTAAIGSDLMLQQASMVTSIDKPKQTSAPTATKFVTKKPEARITLVSETRPRPIMETDATGLHSSRRQTTGPKPGIPQESLSPQKSSPYEPKLVSTAQLSEAEQFVERVKGNFLVWKKEDGTLGFGNVQYPNSEEMIIYDKGEWIQIRQLSPILETKTETQQARVEKKATVDRLAAAYSSRFLVWKDPEGTVCLSNVQYPNSQDIQIHVEGSWQFARN